MNNDQKVDDLIPALDILDDLMLKGAEIKHNGKFWQLKNINEIICTGETIRKLLVNLILMKC